MKIQNFINLGIWVDFVHDIIVSKTLMISKTHPNNVLLSIDTEDRKRKEYMDQLDIRIIFTMVYVLTNMVNETLKVFLTRANISLDNPGTTYMKNEFLYRSILLMPAKKHYMSGVSVQEGVHFNEPKFDVKGMEFRKPSLAGPYARKFAEELLYKDIIMADDWKPNFPKIINDINQFSKDIEKSVYNGEGRYIKSVKVKPEDAYDDPMKIGSYKAAYVWNTLFPDKKIELPGIANMVKIDISKPKDFAHLSVSNPEAFEKLTELFKNERILKSGITNIALPLDEKMPEWVKEFINIDEIITNNTKLITPALGCIGMRSQYKYTGTSYISNIIDI